jgi:hypothetical protein
MKYWTIANLDGMEDDGSLLHTVPAGCRRMMSEYRSRIYYQDRARAESEMLRLKEKYPYNDFALFEAVATVSARDIGGSPVYHIDEIED